MVSAFDLRKRSTPLLSTPYTFLQCSLIAVITVTCGFDKVKGLMGHFVWIISLVCMHLPPKEALPAGLIPVITQIQFPPLFQLNTGCLMVIRSL